MQAFSGFGFILLSRQVYGVPKALPVGDNRAGASRWPQMKGFHQMKNHNIRNHRYATFVLLFIALILSACGATGDDALEKMSAEELAFVEKIKMIKPEMTETDVANLLGPVYRGSGTARPAWLGPTNDSGSQILVYFVDGRIYKVRWMKLGSFVWEYTP